MSNESLHKPGLIYVSVPDALSVEEKIASLFFKPFFFSLSDVRENGDAAFIRRGIRNRNDASYVVSINSSIKNHCH